MSWKSQILRNRELANLDLDIGHGAPNRIRKHFAFCIGVAVPDADGTLETARGRMAVPTYPRGSGFAVAGQLVLTCEHVRRAARALQAHRGGVLVACPYVGGGQPAELRHAWTVDVLAHSDESTPTEVPHLPEGVTGLA